MGRPPLLLDADRRERFLQAPRAGCTRKDAALYCGTSERTVRGWLQRGRHDEDEQIEDSVYADFVFEVERAETEARVQAVFVIRRAMLTSSWAALKFLERRDPAHWSEKVILRHLRDPQPQPQPQSLAETMPPRRSGRSSWR
jgi:hypothetical protein